MAIKIYPPLVEVTNFPASQDVVVTNTPDVNANADLTDTYYPIEGGVSPVSTENLIELILDLVQ